MIHPYIYVGTFKKFMPLGKLTKEEILKVICRELQMDFDEVKNRKTRLRGFVYARQLYSYFCKKYTNESLTNMGKFIHKDHATMIHSINQIKGFYDFDKVIKKDVDKINTILKHKVVNHTADKREKIGNEIILKYQF
ncbi:MAG: helix-turn-helix domain-containing protein [Polaribacter sp.]|uniref:helix-turn-helix domain-containing protein n=1 Tax=Polaribacter sp. TaxID=1920175 RepID=UPI003EF7A408